MAKMGMSLDREIPGKSSPVIRLMQLCCTGIISIFNGNYRDIFYYINMRIHGIDLSPVSIEDLDISSERANASTSSSGAALERMLNTLKITSNDTIVDLGCGKGGAIITFVKYPFKKIAGVDISPEMVRIAQSNLSKLGIQGVALYVCDAGDFENLDEFSYVYMNNPFPEVVVDEVITNLANSLARSPRGLTIIYRYPLWHKAVIKNALFKRTTVLWIGNIPFYIYKHNP